MRALKIHLLLLGTFIFAPLQAVIVDSELLESSTAFVSDICRINQSLNTRNGQAVAALQERLPDLLPQPLKTAFTETLLEIPQALSTPGQRGSEADATGLASDENTAASNERGFSIAPITRGQGATATPLGQRFTWHLDLPESGLNAAVKPGSAPGEAISVSVLGANEPVAFVLQVGVARPQLLLRLDAGCQPVLSRMISYDASGRQLALYDIDSKGQATGQPEWLNPPLPAPSNSVPDVSTFASKDGQQAKALLVALIDSGVNYLLPQINDALARDADGQLLGYDFWDGDNLPFDSHPSASAFSVQRHGTRTAALFLEESPFVTLVPFRYPRGNMHRMESLLKRIDELGITLVGMPLGGNRRDDWEVFYQQAQQYPHILFVVSAGNNERDIGQQPVYPAALDLPNMVVVTSADDTARPARGSNWSRQHVDYLLPAENLELLDFDGNRTYASGSSYAVSRMLAMLARMVVQNPDWQTADLLNELRRRFNDGASARYVTGGYIGDPLSVASTEPLLTLQDSLELGVGSLTPAAELSGDGKQETDKYLLQANFVVLHESWTTARIQPLIDRLAAVIAVCGIELQPVTVKFYDAQPQLRVMSVGAARTLRRELSLQRPTVYLLEQTRTLRSPDGEYYRFDAEAFGRGNTRYRSWLLDTVWIAASVVDADLAVAHELLHVLMNTGEHNNIEGNLMNAATSPDNHHLNQQQCQRAIENGLANGLLQASTR